MSGKSGKSGKSEAVVGFIANLLPLYDGERHEDLCCARSLIDGTLNSSHRRYRRR